MILLKVISYEIRLYGTTTRKLGRSKEKEHLIRN